MAKAQDLLNQYYLEMRWRCLSLAADLDRVGRGTDSSSVIESDPRLQKLHRALTILGNPSEKNRAEQVQMIFSDLTPPPTR
jgi:hypothetical protein